MFRSSFDLRRSAWVFEKPDVFTVIAEMPVA
jgi:hypothetical protein